MFAAEQQLEAANGPGDTPFVTVKVTVDDKSQAVVEAFQVRIILFSNHNVLMLFYLDQYTMHGNDGRERIRGFS